jgi:hypothetical protein
MEHKRIQYSLVQSLHFGAAIGIAAALQRLHAPIPDARQPVDS